MTQLRVILGAGTTTQDGWISTQEAELNLLEPADFHRLFGQEGVDAFLAEHVWEHMTEQKGQASGSKLLRRSQTWRLHSLRRTGCKLPQRGISENGADRRPWVTRPSSRLTQNCVDYRLLISVFEDAGFEVTLLEYCDNSGNFHCNWWDPDDGKIGRSFRFDTRNTESKLGMVKIILDARKP